jgi:hypothetical protein
LQLSVWIRSILVAHAALLVSMPDVSKLLQVAVARHVARVAFLTNVLQPMYQMIEARVAVHPKLLRLSGRLDLAMSQVHHCLGFPLCRRYRHVRNSRFLFAAKAACPIFRSPSWFIKTMRAMRTMPWRRAAAAAAKAVTKMKMTRMAAMMA